MVQSTPRAGTVLIVVAGISALLMSVSLVYIVNMRSDVEESDLMMREAQARLVLIAGLQYIQEASRLGWDNPATPVHEEAFGWADVRDGSAGPKDRFGNLLYDPTLDQFPTIGGKAARFPLYVMERPPFALKQSFTYNPAPLDASKTWAELVNYTNRDPQPAATTWADFADGKPQPRMDSIGRSWMRIYRERVMLGTQIEPATFTITCGAGSTQGFRTYLDAANAGEGAYFNNDPLYFALLRSQERILWFRAQWTSAVGGSSKGVRMKNGFVELPEINKESYYKLPTYDVYGGTPAAGTDHHWWVNRNPLGSILWIQRLDGEPTDW